MKHDTVIIGGGLTGLLAGINLQKAGQSTIIVSSGQNALHFFSGAFESISELPPLVADTFAEAGVRVHYKEGVSLLPMGNFRKSFLSLEDLDIFPEAKFASKALVVNFMGYHDFFSSFIAEGLENAGIQTRIRFIRLPEMEHLRQSPSEMRSVQIARTMDRIWEKVVKEIRMLLKDEDAVILPQVFGLQDTTVPGRIREAIPAKVVFTGTLPPSVPGVRTIIQLRRRYEVLGGTYLMGDQVIKAHVHDNTVHSVATKNLESHYLEGRSFILSSGGFFSKGLTSTPSRIFEPVFGLDIEYPEDRNAWYNPDFMGRQPYMEFGVKVDQDLHAISGGVPYTNLYAAGGILGYSSPGLGYAGGMAINSAFKVVDQILKDTRA